MNRFSTLKKNFPQINKLKLPIIAFLIVFIFFLYGIQSISDTASKNQAESLENAIYRSVTQCYAVEGTYPPSLAYLKEHYGLIYDTDSFFVDYQPIGSNIMPDITIITKNHNSEGESHYGF